MSKPALVVPLQPGIGLEMFRKFLTDPFAERFGVDVRTPERSEYFVEDVAEDVRLGRHSFDVVEWPQYDFLRVKREGLCEPLDFSSMPSVGKVDRQFIDPEGFGVGVFVYGMVPVFIADMVPRPLRSWADLWDPTFKGRIALRDQLVAGKLMAITCKVLGIITSDLIRDDVYEAAWAKLTDLVGNAGAWVMSEGHIQDLIASRELAISHQFIDVAQIQRERGIGIDVVFPEEGPIWAYRSWTIVRGCRNRDLAQAFINFAQSEERQKALVETFYGLPTNSVVQIDPSLLPKIRGSAKPHDAIDFPTWDWYFARKADADERWRELVARRP